MNMHPNAKVIELNVEIKTIIELVKLWTGRINI